MERKNKVIVKINGQDYPIVGAEPKDYLLRVGNYVDEQMARVTKNNNRLSISMIAVLTSINIADQFLKLQSQMDNIKRDHIDPLKELEQMKVHYESVVKELATKKENASSSKKQIEQLIAQKEEMKDENTKLKKSLQNKEKNLADAEAIINDLQNKLFENQIKLVQMRKDLDEYIENSDDI